MSVILFLLISPYWSPSHCYFQWHNPSHPPGCGTGLGRCTSGPELNNHIDMTKLPGNWVKQMMECNVIIQLNVLSCVYIYIYINMYLYIYIRIYANAQNVPNLSKSYISQVARVWEDKRSITWMRVQLVGFLPSVGRHGFFWFLGRSFKWVFERELSFSSWVNSGDSANPGCSHILLDPATKNRLVLVKLSMWQI